VQATVIAISTRKSALEALRAHWPEYLSEAAALGIFMSAACASSVILDAFPDGVWRRIAGGIAMGLTAVALISSPLGQRSGAHMNPAFTLTFFMLGKIAPWDAFFYAVAQFAGALGGVLAARAAIGPTVNYAVTAPGPAGMWAAFAGEFTISFLIVTIVLNVSNSPRTARYTPWMAGFLIATFISIEAPLSGMSMNPARTFGSALPANVWTGIWIYFVAPPLAMLMAARLYVHSRGAQRVFCAKYHHHNQKRCIFRCNYGALQNEQ
jgi:aquaporin Z